MQDKFAIRLAGVTKSYRLYSSPLLMGADLLNIPFFRKRIERCPLFQALKGIDLTVEKGERLGIVGRNGAGKTTLLKLITGNFLPTSGEVEINGQVQSLMDAGLGFHPEFSGRQNIRASLIYNGLSEPESVAAENEIIEFVELGEFIDQPIKTYSLGMATRLAFATATAIKPEVLIIDEVLSAGDGYFAAKSAERVKRLTSGGTTLLLVSHSTDQILQYCRNAVWVDQGRIVMRGTAMEVVKAYQAYLQDLEETKLADRNLVLAKRSSQSTAKNAGDMAPPALSRWTGRGGLNIQQVRVRDADKRDRFLFTTGQSVEFELEIESEVDGRFDCQYHFNIFSLDGRNVTSHMSAPDQFELRTGERRIVRLVYDRLLLGNGTYVVTAGLFRHMDQRDHSTAERYDLLDRSFEFQVVSKYRLNESLVFHPSRWIAPGGEIIQDVTEDTLQEGKQNPAFNTP
jgi:lipopolysaccharide transport system ATP-binding protein